MSSVGLRVTKVGSKCEAVDCRACRANGPAERAALEAYAREKARLGLSRSRAPARIRCAYPLVVEEVNLLFHTCEIELVDQTFWRRAHGRDRRRGPWAPFGWRR